MKQGLFHRAEEHYPPGGIIISARALVVEATYYALAEKLQFTALLFLMPFSEGAPFTGQALLKRPYITGRLPLQVDKLRKHGVGCCDDL
jgi:hypothetical protein